MRKNLKADICSSLLAEGTVVKGRREMSNKRFVYYFAEKSWIIVQLMISESKMQLQGRLSENVIYPKRFPLLPTTDKDITGPALPLTFDVL